MQLMNSIRQFLGFPQPETPCVPSAAVDRMLADLHRLCATLPGGEVEVFLSSRCVNLQLSWTPEAEESGAAAYRPETGIGVRLDGRSDRAIYREVVEPAAVTEEEAEVKKAAAAAEEEEVKEEKAEEAEVKDNTEVSSEAVDSQAEKDVKQVTGESSLEMKDTVEPVKEMQVTVKEPADSPKATAEPMKITAESASEDTDFGEASVEEKPSKTLLNLRRLKDFLQQHYAFRYNRLTDCTECAVLTAGQPPLGISSRGYPPLEHPQSLGPRSWGGLLGPRREATGGVHADAFLPSVYGLHGEPSGLGRSRPPHGTGAAGVGRCGLGAPLPPLDAGGSRPVDERSGFR